MQKSNSHKIQNIVCVDDDQEILNLFEMLLGDLPNVKIHLFTNAYDALNAMPPLQPTLALLDIMMPEMNGLFAYQKIQSDTRLKNMQVIFVTARTRDIDMQQYESLGVHTVTKPFDPQIFKDLIAGLI